MAFVKIKAILNPYSLLVFYTHYTFFNRNKMESRICLPIVGKWGLLWFLVAQYTLLYNAEMTKRLIVRCVWR
jgi:hypothetical protein